MIEYHGLTHSLGAADIVGQIAQVTRAGNIPNIDPSSPFAFAALTSSSPPSVFLNGQVSRFRESLDITELLGTSAPHLAYQYICIVVARFSGSTSSKEILSLTRQLLGNIIITPVTPLHHNLALLVAATLTDLSDQAETQVEAQNAIKEMDDALQAGNIVHRSPNGTEWDTAIRNMLHLKKSLSPPTTATERASSVAQPNMAGLQHLAAAAVGEREGGTDVRPASSGGNGTLPQPTPDMKHDVTAAIAAANEAAAAQATAAAVQKQLQSVPAANSSGGNNFDPSALVKEGF